MRVRIVSYSKPSDDFEFNGLLNLQDLVAFCAIVSNPSNQLNTSTSEKLIRYLIKNKHFSPLEMVSACLEIETTRDIARQILRHRSFSFSEFSQRYSDASQLGFEVREARLQDHKNRQNSIEITDQLNSDAVRLTTTWESYQSDIKSLATEAYKWALDNGIAKEQARAVLPEGMTVSRLYMNGTLRSWLHYCELRVANGTQKEHQLVAKECAKVITEVFPLFSELLQ